MLVISTATKKAMIALEVNGVFFKREFESNAKYSEILLEQIDSLLCDAKIELGNIKNIGIVIGPGSFTGLRIGVALVKGLFANFEDVNIFPISTLQLMAYSFTKLGQRRLFCTVMNALSGRFYVCQFDKNGNAVGQEKLVFEEELKKYKGVKVCLKDDLQMDCEIDFNAENLMEYLTSKIDVLSSFKAENLAPVYLRKSQAEENL